MYYIFDKDGKCIASCDGKPNMDDLATRDETAQERYEMFEISQIQLINGEIVMKQD